MPRDNFSPAVKRQLGERVAYFCSNPSCCRLTIGPDEASESSLKTGTAAHICAASPGGLRYDAEQTPAERRASANGIWLCRECGDLVDKGVAGYSAYQLRRWKAQTEAVMSDVRTKGYSDSIELLRSQRIAPDLVREVVSLLDDRRLFWVRFDAEFPDRVRISLDNLRHSLNQMRGRSPAGPLKKALEVISSTIRQFFDAVEHLDLTTLRCDSGNPDWLEFEGALKILRKSAGFQIKNLADAYGVEISPELASTIE